MKKYKRRQRVFDLKPAIGSIPYRMALAGGWIDQPFVSRANPHPPGSMVVVSLLPTVRFMERAGMATSTRSTARRIWGNALPKRSPSVLVRELYEAENASKDQPSGSQDMIGIVYPGICRLDYDASHEGGVFPCAIETCCDRRIASWLEQNVHLIPVEPRPDGYNPLLVKRLDPAWISRLGLCGRQCFDAILKRNIDALGASFNEHMRCCDAILPCMLHHPSVQVDLKALLKCYQRAYPGAMYCGGGGGGYLLVASSKPVPGAFHVSIRLDRQKGIHHGCRDG